MYNQIGMVSSMFNGWSRTVWLLRVIAAAFLVLLLVARPSTASAHAAMAASQPQQGTVVATSPDRVIVWFTEAIEPRLSTIQVLDASGREVDNRDTAQYGGDATALSVTLPVLPDGTYTVAWHNVSTSDGHAESGSFVFYVGTGPANAPPVKATTAPLFQSPAEPAFHWIELLAMLTITGSLIFELFITRPLLGRDGAGPLSLMARRMGFRTFRIVVLAGAAFLLASLAELVLKASVAHAVPWYQAISHHSVSTALHTAWGHIWLLRMASAVCLLAATGIVYPAKAQISFLKDWRFLALLPALLSLFTLTLASHDAGLPGLRAAGIFSDYIHLVAAGAWVGGLVYLALIVPAPMKRYLFELRGEGRPIQGPYCPGFHASALKRFAAISLFSAGALVVTGLYSAWAQVATFGALITPYGYGLLAKLLLLVPLLVLGAVNFLKVVPSLAVEAEGLAKLRATTVTQASLACMLVLAVAFMLSLEPARLAAAARTQPQGTAVATQADWANLNIRIDPATVGDNTITVSLRDPSGTAVNDASSIGLFMQYTQADLGPYWQYAKPAGNGTYVLQSNLSVAGPWNVILSVQRPGSFDVNTTLGVQVTPAKPGKQTASSPSPTLGNVLWAGEAVVLVLLFLVVGRVVRR